MRISRETPALFSARATTRTSALALAALITVALHATAASGQTKAATPAPQQPDNTPARRSADAARQQSTVRGRVIYDDTDRPLRRVGVTIYDPNSRDGRGRRMAWTDGRGEFVIKNVAAGTYYALVEAPGIIKQDQPDPAEPSKGLPSVSVDGTNSGEVKIRVRRGGAISGKITYPDGDPVMNATISLLRKKDGKLLPVYTGGRHTDRAQTDERGVYRVSGLSPGEYIIAAAEEKMRAEDREEEEEGIRVERAVLAATYYPNSTSTAAATPLQVEGGSEIEDINITLAERTLHVISGTVTARSDGRPISDARVGLADKDEAANSVVAFSEPRSATTDAQGNWTLDEVGDGVYTITVTPMSDVRAYARGSEVRTRRAAPRFVVKRQEVTVGGADVSGLTLEVSEGGRVSGTVTVDGGKPLPREVIVVAVISGGERSADSTVRALVKPDGTFDLDGIPSSGVHMRTIVLPYGSHYTKSATANGVDLLREPLNVDEGGEVKGVRLVISPDVATLTGRVLAEKDGTPVRGVSVLLVPADPTRQRFRGARLYGFTNAEGSFTVSGAPGEYTAAVLRPGDDAYALDDDTIRARAAGGQVVTLQPSERKNITLVAPTGR